MIVIDDNVDNCVFNESLDMKILILDKENLNHILDNISNFLPRGQKMRFLNLITLKRYRKHI